MSRTSQGPGTRGGLSATLPLIKLENGLVCTHVLNRQTSWRTTFPRKGTQNLYVQDPKSNRDSGKILDHPRPGTKTLEQDDRP